MNRPRGSPLLADRLFAGMLAAPVLAFAALCLLLLLWGCATTRQSCEYHSNGRLERYQLRTAILGTGETELVTTDCAALAQSTKDTGLSDNGTDALGVIAEGAAKGLSPVP